MEERKMGRRGREKGIRKNRKMRNGGRDERREKG